LVAIAAVGTALSLEASPGEAVATRFARLFIEGRIGEAEGMIALQLAKVMPPGSEKEIVADLVGEYGALQSFGTAWHEDTVGAFDRYRVPVVFERETVDLRVVIDGDGLVSGVFLRAHLDPATIAESPVSELPVRVGGEEGLPGVLSLPEGVGPHPGVVLVHGSGPHDRDQTIGPNKPFRDLAWGLAERGVAVLRYDKRSLVRPEELAALGDELTVVQEAIEDAREAARLLHSLPEIDGTRIYLLGHSLGGTVLPRIAAMEPRPAGLIVLAGSALPLHEKVLAQTRYIATLDGELSDAERAASEKIESIVASIRAGLESGTPPAAGQDLLGAPFGYWADLAAHDAPAEAAGLGLPILVLQGARDYQVTLDDFALWHDALEDAAGACLVLYDGLDHLFREGSGKSGPEDYAEAAPVSPAVIVDVTGWLLERSCPERDDPSR
jgi:dienelactone hydrolase